MAAIDELIEQIDNPALRERIAAEVHRVVRQKKFGLVFEEHLPERTLLYEVPVQRGSLVARNGNAKDVYQVIGIDGDKAECYSKNDKTQVELNVIKLSPNRQISPLFIFGGGFFVVCMQRTFNEESKSYLVIAA